MAVMHSAAQPDIARQHLQTVLLEALGNCGEPTKLILEYMVEHALIPNHIGVMDIAQDVFGRHDSQMEQQIRTAKKTLKNILERYYQRKGSPGIRFVLPPYGMNLTIQDCPGSSRRVIDPLIPTVWDHFETSARLRADEMTAAVGAFLHPSIRRAGDAVQLRLVWRDVFAPAYRELHLVHADYLRMFISARALARRRLDVERVRSIANRLTEQRMTLEAVRQELHYLFSKLQETSSAYPPVAGEFIQAAYSYVAPPKTGTQSFNLIRNLHNCASLAEIDETYDLNREVREGLDESITGITSGIKRIIQAYVEVWLAALR